MRGIVGLLLLGAALSACGDDGGDDPSPRSVVFSIQDCEAAQLATPGQRIELALRITEGAAPAKGVRVVFMAPDDRGATFTEPHAFGSNYGAAISGTDGIARASLTVASSEDAYLIAAVQEDGSAEASFAITVTSTAPNFAVSAKLARCRAETALGQLPAGSLLHGPVLLPAGAIVTSAGAGLGEETAGSVTRTAPSWFLWLDELPDGGFNHPTRFVHVDAADVVITNQRWWPEITLPASATPIVLRPAYVNNRATSPVPTVVRGTRSQPSHTPGQHACAIIYHGTPDNALRNQASDAADFFRNTMGLPHVYDKRDAMGNLQAPTFMDLVAMVDQAIADGCTKMYLAMFSHGFSGGVGNNGTGGGRPITYKQLSDMLVQKLGDRIELCLIIDACEARSVVHDMFGRGLRGDIVTSAQDTEYMLFRGDYPLWRERTHFGHALFECWSDLAVSSTPGQLPTLLEALRWVQTQNDPEATNGHPDNDPIPRDPLPMSVPDVVIDLPENFAHALLNVPADPRYRTHVQVTTANPAIAAGSAPPAQIPPGQQAATTLICESIGTTTYTARVVRPTSSEIYEGTGNVTVRNCPTFTVEPITAAYDVDLHQTTYTSPVSNPRNELLTITWAGPDCGFFMPSAPFNIPSSITAALAWTHECAGNPTHDAVSVTLNVSGPSGSIKCSYLGVQTGTGPPCSRP